MRNLIILVGVIAVLSAAVPGFLQGHPDLLSLLTQSRQPRASSLPVTASAEPQAQQVLSSHDVRLVADQRGHFRGDFLLNGYQVSGLVDTGATFVALNSETARLIGIHLSQSDYRYRVSTANGTAMAAAATIDSLDIGHIHMEKVQALVLDDDALSGTLIGMSFLKRLAKYDVEGDRLVLQQ